MAFLLDTQIIIWIEEDPAKISPTAHSILETHEDVYFSKASVWEMAIKVKTGKLNISQPLPAFIGNFRKDYKFNLLDISLSHIFAIVNQPLHHRDPFDRLLIAQSLTEGFAIISSDSAFDAYGVNRVW
jgi:PIN domain nuclease of toxin-antitoxin system